MKISVSRNVFLPAAIACMLVGCAPKPQPDNRSIVKLSDHARMSRLTAEATKLIDGKKTTPMETLVKQLNRKQTALSLPTRRTQPLSRPDIYRRNVPGVLIVSGLHKCKKCTK